MTFLQTNFEIESLELEICHSDKNIFPLDFRKKVFWWCGSGTHILVHYTKAGGLPGLKSFDKVKTFLQAIKDLDDTLGFLK